jgi:tubulin alpha
MNNNLSNKNNYLPPILQREVISVHIGQAGVQMGNAAWELFCLEHGRTISHKVVSMHRYKRSSVVSNSFWTAAVTSSRGPARYSPHL